MAEGYTALIIGAATKGATVTLVKNYAEKVINPFIKMVQNQKSQSIIKGNLGRYTRNVEARTRSISSIAIPGGVFPLDEVYEPLRLRSEIADFSSVIDKYPSEMFSASRCCAITDHAGMGKSTLAKFIVRSSIKENKPVPLLIELRRIRRGDSILDALCRELADGTRESQSGTDLLQLFRDGNFVFILDGYDEIDEDARDSVTQEINQIAAEFQFCYFILTSRKEYGTSLFPEFISFEICDLEVEQAHSLIAKYDQNRGQAKQLISKIEEADVGEFLGNPLLVTLLYKAFDYRPFIPPRRATFFRQVFEALFMDHDLSKGDAYERKKLSGLDVDDFHKFIRSLGLTTLKSGRVAYSAEEFHQHLESSASRSGLKPDLGKIRSDLLRAVPLFVKDGSEVRWAHKSFQEYFAAQYIYLDAGNKRDSAIVQMFQSRNLPTYLEVLRFLSESSINMIQDALIEPLLRTAIEDSAESDPYLAITVKSADIYYLGNIPAKSEIKGRQTIMTLLKERTGFDAPDLPWRVFVDYSKRFSVVTILNNEGVRFASLPYFDKSNFSIPRKLPPARLYQEIHAKHSGGTARLNGDVKDVGALEGVFGDRVQLSAFTGIPIITRALYEKLRKEKEARKVNLEEDVLGAL